MEEKKNALESKLENELEVFKKYAPIALVALGLVTLLPALLSLYWMPEFREKWAENTAVIFTVFICFLLFVTYVVKDEQVKLIKYSNAIKSFKEFFVAEYGSLDAAWILQPLSWLNTRFIKFDFAHIIYGEEKGSSNSFKKLKTGLQEKDWNSAVSNHYSQNIKKYYNDLLEEQKINFRERLLEPSIRILDIYISRIQFVCALSERGFSLSNILEDELCTDLVMKIIDEVDGQYSLASRFTKIMFALEDIYHNTQENLKKDYARDTLYHTLVILIRRHGQDMSEEQLQYVNKFMVGYQSDIKIDRLSVTTNTKLLGIELSQQELAILNSEN